MKKKSKLNGIKTVLNTMGIEGPQPGDIAEYEDEDNPTTVVIRRKDGTFVMSMPVEVWDQIRALKE